MFYSTLYELFRLCLLVSSADIFYKQFGSRSGLTKHQACSGSKLYDTLMVFLKENFEEKNDEKEKSADYELPITNYQYIAYISVTFCVIYMPFLIMFFCLLYLTKKDMQHLLLVAFMKT